MSTSQPPPGTPLLYGFIMAGGIGSRLWPRSRRRTPKQFLDLTSNETMLQEAYRRLLPIIPAERLLVGTGAEYAAAVCDQLPDLPPGNVVVEPAGRGTAPAIGLGALHIHRRAPEAVMVVVTADHHIGDAPLFRRILLAAAAIAEQDDAQAGTTGPNGIGPGGIGPGALVTLGITPTFASTGYGYVQRSDLLCTWDGLPAYRVVRFAEKPDAATAAEFVSSAMFSWNSGMFIWKVQAIRAEFERQMPELWAQLCEIEGALGTPDEQVVLERVWSAVAKQTIDYGIMEGASNVAVIPASIGWNDIGTWETLIELLQANDDIVDDAGNVAVGEHILVDTHNTLIHSPKKLVATIGLRDMVVIETDDALLICPMERSQDVRQVVDLLRERGREDLL
jgi:mannose-1-phosphate guanylyltransferase